MKAFIKFLRATVLFLLSVTVFSSCEKEIMQVQSDGYNQYEDYPKGAKIVEIEYRGEKILCRYLEGVYIIQGDIIIRDDNIEIDTTLQDKQIQKAVMELNTRLWPQGKVYYEYYSFATSPLFSHIQNAMNKITSATNIKFIPLYTPQANAYIKNKIVLSNIINSNLSLVGMGNSPYQYLFLDSDFPSALHELCHAIGLEHEHSRPDRDKYIEILEYNIDPQYLDDFKPFNVMGYFSPFDFGSVMMYGSYAGSAIGNPTIRKIDGSLFTVQRSNLSNFDKSVINLMYPKKTVTPDVIIHKNTIQASVTSCELTGEIIYRGDPVITQYGIQYRKQGDNSLLSPTQTTNVNNQGIYKCQLTNLQPNTPYEARAYVVQNYQFFYSEWVPFSTQQGTPAAVSTEYSPSDITGTTAKISIKIDNAGNPSYTEKGICLTPPAIYIPVGGNNGQAGTFSHNLTGLEYNTSYSAKAYVVQNGIAIYGNEITFTTKQVTETQVSTEYKESDIKGTTAIISGRVTNIGDPPYTERGICWSTHSNPTTNDKKITANGQGQLGLYSCNLTGLEYNTSYYAKAYVVQNSTIVYGDKVTFTTKPVTDAQISTENVSEIEGTTAKVSIKIAIAGEPPYTEKGVCWSKSPNPTIDDFKKLITGNNGQAGTFSCDLTGLEPSTLYYAKAYVKQNGTIIYGSEKSFTTNSWILINGVRWATSNVGNPGAFMANPEDYGGRYQWNCGTTNFIPGYNNDTYSLSWASWLPQNDPCPSGWRVPTGTELGSLGSYTQITQNGVFGRRYGSGTNTIFLPAAGFRHWCYGDLQDVGTSGYYWGMFYSGGYTANCLTFNTSMIPNLDDGCSVRCVKE